MSNEVVIPDLLTVRVSGAQVHGDEISISFHDSDLNLKKIRVKRERIVSLILTNQVSDENCQFLTIAFSYPNWEE